MSQSFDTDPGGFSAGALPSGNRFPYLVILEGPRRGYYYPLKNLPVTIGRKDADVLPDPEDQGLSRLHAVIEKEEGNVILKDNNSTNGTLVNGHPTLKTFLRNGDKISVGNSTLKYVTTASQAVSLQSRALDAERRDKLTGAFTNAYLKEKYTEAYAEADLFSVSYGLLLFEVDKFVEIRSRFGLKVSNKVLIDLAEFVSSLLLEDQELFRISGAAFGVLLIGPSAKFIRDVGEMIRQSCESSEFNHEGTDIPLTLSLGVAYQEGGTKLPSSVDEIFEKAERLMLQAREQGGNRIRG